LAKLFPEGLQAAATTMPEKPAKGVFVNKDSERSRKAGVRAGDIIVGLEGWRVENDRQYFAINTFKDVDVLKLTVWRGQLFAVEVPAPRRLMGVELNTYPLKGWIQ